ncbi:MAG: pantoate--beta-alanine ligase [Cyclobacteriaceae bacterium]
MEIFNEIEPLRAFLRKKSGANVSVGLVPTMGALHEGHLALIRSCKAENELTVCTIYVNPTQFNNPSDLDNYPRTVEKDTALLIQAGVDILFMPPNSEMYSSQQSLSIDFGTLDKVLEGKFRPGHFSGVALVVSKLFNIIQPTRAYFGQKDYQQFQIISSLKEELKFDIDLRSVPIVREVSGLALSSRNQRLTDEEKKSALLLFESLSHAKREILDGADFVSVKREIEAKFDKLGATLEYFELAHKNTLQPFDRSSSLKDAILLIAAFVGDVRLIDNMLLFEEE